MKPSSSPNLGLKLRELHDSPIRFQPKTAKCGGGVEYMINCHWSAKLEYKHLFLGRNHIHGSTIETFDGDVSETAEQETYKSKAEQDTVQVGLNYKF